MQDLIAEQKNLVRKQCRRIRNDLEIPFRLQASREICSRISDWQVFQRAQVVLTYMPIKAEVDLRALLENHPQKTWVLPRILEGSRHNMSFHIYDAHQLVRHSFGMEEPSKSLPIVSPKEIELALVPGLAYDRHGGRLGYGGGYFDRFLNEFPGVSLGVVYAALLLESLPHGEYDVPVKWVMTESGLYGEF